MVVRRVRGSKRTHNLQYKCGLDRTENAFMFSTFVFLFF